MAKNATRWLILTLAVALVAAACGNGDEGGDGDGEGSADVPKVIRFAFAPDPVWDYLIDSGIREEMETEANIAILDSATWNEVGVYAGGNADIMSVGDFEVPTIEEEFGIPSVIFGKYNIDRSIIVASPEHPEYETLADCEGGTVAVWDTLSSTTIWGMLAHQMHGLDFRVDGGDFELVVVDITNTAEQAASGDTDCAIVLPDFSIPVLINEAVNVLYDGATSADLYADLVGRADHEGPMINIFLAREDWYDDHPDEVAFFLELWDRGLQEWAANRDEIIASYPQHFAAEGDEQIGWMQEYLSEHDWFASGVYLTDEWVESESELFELLNEAGLAESPDLPRFEVVSQG
ncbi:MAG TPA: ABC transporter substrate-binding protein [Acidimicrobiia bacterium]|nr:ABC transporter substrate-binding protein [Acidimicrobiia bacterium]